MKNKKDSISKVITGFFSIFFVAGIILLYSSLKRGGNGGEEWIVGVVFAAIGGCGILFGQFLGRKIKEKEQLKTLYPNEPWMWNKHWARGEGEDLSAAGYAVLLFMALVFLGISAPIIIDVTPLLIKKTLRKEAVALIFPLAGIGFLISGLVMFFRAKKFNDLRCLLPDVPGILGEKMALNFKSSYRFPSNTKAQISVQQIYTYTTGSGKNRSTHHEVQWERSLTAPLKPTGPYYEANVLIEIPIDVEETKALGGNASYYWKTSFNADIPGLNAVKEFRIPVFKVEGRGTEGRKASEIKIDRLVDEGKILESVRWKEVAKLSDPSGGFLYKNIRGHKWSSTIVGSLLGVMFLAGSLFALYNIWTGNTNFFELLVGSIFSLVFGSIGTFILSFSILGKVTKKKIVLSENGVTFYPLTGLPKVYNKELIEDIKMSSNTKVNGKATAWDIRFQVKNKRMPWVGLGPLYSEEEALSILRDIRNYLELGN